MGGLLTHLGIALIGFLIGTFIFKNYKYGLAFVLGHVIPDVIDFGIIGLFSWEFNPSIIMLSPWFRPLAVLGHTWWHWAIFGIGVILILSLLYGFKKIKKSVFTGGLILLGCFLAGVGVHLIVDLLIIETSYWI